MWSGIIVVRSILPNWKKLANLAYDILEQRRELHILKLVRKCISNRSTQLLNNYLFIMEILKVGLLGKVTYCIFQKSD